jgi:thiamine-phosphate diphosphorylase
LIRVQITDGTADIDENAWIAGLSADVDFIQIRERGLNPRDLSRLVRRAMRVGPGILVNDRTDVALATGAAGVHLRGNSVSPSEIRRIAPAGFVITIALHENEAAPAGADFALLAPIFKPLSKSNLGEPLGLAGLRQATGLSKIPILALGGITTENTRQCMEAGAAGVAGITLFRRR